jgi:hypothetical protein
MQPRIKDTFLPKKSAAVPVGISNIKFQNMNQAFKNKIRENLRPPHSV